jgi:hypothetical protein
MGIVRISGSKRKVSKKSRKSRRTRRRKSRRTRRRKSRRTRRRKSRGGSSHPHTDDTDDTYDANDALAAAEAAGAAAARAGAAVRASEAAEAAAHAIDIVEAENLVVATAQAVVAAEAAAGGRSGSERVEFLAVSRQRLFLALVELGLLREQAQARDAATSTGGAVEVISLVSDDEDDVMPFDRMDG